MNALDLLAPPLPLAPRFMSVVLFLTVLMRRKEQKVVPLRQLEGQLHLPLKCPIVTRLLHYHRETWVMAYMTELNTWGNLVKLAWLHWTVCKWYHKFLLLWQDFTDILFMHFPARTSPATHALSPQRTPTAPYPYVEILMNRMRMKRKQRTRQTQSSLKITAANTTTSRSRNISCTTPLRTSCSAMGWSRHQLPAPGIWTDQSQGRWLTAGAQHPRTTSHQAGPASSVRQRDPSLQMEISTRQSPLHGIL